MSGTKRNDPALTQADPARSLRERPDTAAAALAAEVARIDGSVARSAARLDFYDDPARHAALLRRLA